MAKFPGLSTKWHKAIKQCVQIFAKDPPDFLKLFRLTAQDITKWTDWVKVLRPARHKIGNFTGSQAVWTRTTTNTAHVNTCSTLVTNMVFTCREHVNGPSSANTGSVYGALLMRLNHWISIARPRQQVSNVETRHQLYRVWTGECEPHPDVDFHCNRPKCVHRRPSWRGRQRPTAPALAETIHQSRSTPVCDYECGLQRGLGSQ